MEIQQKGVIIKFMNHTSSIFNQLRDVKHMKKQALS